MTLQIADDAGMARPTNAGTLTPLDLRRDSATPGAEDRRREPRIPCQRQVLIAPRNTSGAAGQFKPVGLFDCSGHGLGVISEEPMVVGDQFLAKLQLRHRTALIVYTVRHCQRLDRHFKIGAQFTCFLDTGGAPLTNADILPAVTEAA